LMADLPAGATMLVPHATSIPPPTRETTVTAATATVAKTAAAWVADAALALPHSPRAATIRTAGKAVETEILALAASITHRVKRAPASTLRRKRTPTTPPPATHKVAETRVGVVLVLVLVLRPGPLPLQVPVPVLVRAIKAAVVVVVNPSTSRKTLEETTLPVEEQGRIISPALRLKATAKVALSQRSTFAISITRPLRAR